MADQNTTPSAAGKPHGTPAASKSAAQAPSGPAAADSSGPKGKAPPRGYPIFRVIGFPNFRLRLPSRNWLIFFGITGSWTAAYLYDRREKKRIQKKWCDVVSHIAQETMPQQNMMPRRVTIFLTSSPGDGITPIRDHFREYVKPVLVAGALDWDVVEGRREGEVRVGLAERIRKMRKANEGPKKEGSSVETELDNGNVEDLVKTLRARSGVRDWEGVKGDIVIGRHTWKEYVYGLHEGWLGPLEDPSQQSTPSSVEIPPPDGPSTTTAGNSDMANGFTSDTAASSSTDDLTTSQAEDTTEEKQKEEEKKDKQQPPPKPPVPAAYITPSEYSSAALAPSTPEAFTPATIIPFPHMLGFLNTPTNMYRFLTKRYLADDTGRQTAAAILAAHRSFHGSEANSASTSLTSSTAFSSSPATVLPLNGDTSAAQSQTLLQTSTQTEQYGVLAHEEADWPKHIRRPKDPATRQGKIWTEPMMLEPRIAERMRRFEVAADEEARAERISQGIERPIQVMKPGDVDLDAGINGEASRS